MPADLALSTNTPTATFELHQLQPLGDGIHHAAFLIVRSGPFAAATPFIVTSDALQDFSFALDMLLRARDGRAALMARDERDVVAFESVDGALRATGELHDADDAAQRLSYGYMAEWDGLPALADGLKAALAST